MYYEKLVTKLKRVVFWAAKIAILNEDAMVYNQPFSIFSRSTQLVRKVQKKFIRAF